MIKVDEMTMAKKETVYLYGMRFRGFAPGCQPMDGLIGSQDDVLGEYHNVLSYNRVLSQREEDQYELDYIGSRIKR